jgi:Uma2 family endonuclease
MIVTATEVQNSFGKYLKLLEKEDVIITRNGKKIARLSVYRDWEDGCALREGCAEYSHAGMKVSYEEFLKISEESENRYEYIDGEIYLLASPFYAHQKAVREILSEFTSWFRGKECEPLASPFDVTLFKSDKNINVVQPDILVFCDRENIDEKGRYKGTPALVAEVLSESTRSKDMVKKLDLYMLSGVKEYWVVNTASQEVYIYVFKDSNIEEILTFKRGQKVESVTFNGLCIELDRIFT